VTEFVLVAQASDALQPLRFIHKKDCEKATAGVPLGAFPTATIALKQGQTLYRDVKLCPDCCLNTKPNQEN